MLTIKNKSTKNKILKTRAERPIKKGKKFMKTSELMILEISKKIKAIHAKIDFLLFDESAHNYDTENQIEKLNAEIDNLMDKEFYLLKKSL